MDQFVEQQFGGRRNLRALAGDELIGFAARRQLQWQDARHLLVREELRDLDHDQRRARDVQRQPSRRDERRDAAQREQPQLPTPLARQHHRAREQVFAGQAPAAARDRLVIFLGDVSGKGIPASMFMVRAISLARLLARDIAEPEIILARLNDELAVDNPSCMFVTFICAVFDPASGNLTIANGGHCRPVLLRPGEAPAWAVKNLGTALGFEEGLDFERTEITLRPGDAIVFYTDGVSEAFNPEDECYGDDRLIADTALLAGQSAPLLTGELLKKVHAFANGAPQSDDIAILSLKIGSFSGREGAL